MIGVIADFDEQDVVREFFELFKTPWEFCRDLGNYDVVLCNGDNRFNGSAKLVLVYADKHTSYDDDLRIQTGAERKQPSTLSYDGERIPIYGNAITFTRAAGRPLTDDDSEVVVFHQKVGKETAICRIGYDLFSEVRQLLTVGQPASNAATPTLELHIALLRDLITGSGLPLVEIPAVPEGYDCIACLTHDVDHPFIRRHIWDHTAFGFLYRALVGSLRNFIRGRISVRDLGKNWRAVLMLPLVYCGFAKDFWRDFDDCYLKLEAGLRSTFFVIPFGGRPGTYANGARATRRAANYGAQDVTDALRKLKGGGCEIGLHGIDAWCDSSAGRREALEICRLTGDSEIGVRMHWLYFDEHSPETLEKAGLTYDSSMGYNETVGYRAGTTQPYKPLDTSRMLELPLHVMDTALFYPAYLDLSPRDAKAVLNRMTDNAVQFGGCFTINWHDRSTAPERLWETPYRELIEDLKSRGAWFATARDVVAWFRMRRSAVFETGAASGAAAGVRIAFDQNESLPSLRLRVHHAFELSDDGTYAGTRYSEMPLHNTTAEAHGPCVVN